MGTNSPLITDWIQAIGMLLGIPATIYGIFLLFKKDMAKEKQIESLVNIATSQDAIVKELAEQVEQLSLQTNEFQYQSSLMRNSNKILEKQMELQREIYLYQKGTDEQRIEIENMKRVNEIKPYFVQGNSWSTGEGRFELPLENKGEEARNIQYNLINSDFVNIVPFSSINIPKGSKIKISGGIDLSKTNLNARDVPFELELIYQDVDGNKYSQNIKKLKAGKYIIEEPKALF